MECVVDADDCLCLYAQTVVPPEIGCFCDQRITSTSLLALHIALQHCTCGLSMLMLQT